MAKQKHALSVTRADNYPDWYQEVISQADLAEHSAVRGCMIIKPWGYAIWENMQHYLDQRFKETGHQNAYFPLLIPLSYIQQEAEHVEGFAKECAVVTHHRLEEHDGQLTPAGKLDEPYVIRPTSETIVGTSFAKWIQSYRDLPLKINQWANVMRWEMRTRLFLRTSEFLWQEGHTAHASTEEALEETLTMLDVYEAFAQDILAIPVIKGEKTPEERFPGADNTFTIEAMMQDGKALQAGTSHFLGQNFARSFDMTYQDKEGQLQTAWTTSWGMTTRMIGALIMTHSDDDGLVLPPRIAPVPIVILPILRKDCDEVALMAHCQQLQQQLCQQTYHGRPLQVEIDDRDLTSGEKKWHHVKKGTPVRLEIGPRDLANQCVCVARRDCAPQDKEIMSQEQFIEQATQLLDNIQSNLYHRAQTFQQENSQQLESWEEFQAFFAEKASGGYAYCISSLDPDIEQLIKPLKVSARCIPLAAAPVNGHCLFTGKPASHLVVYARAY